MPRTRTVFSVTEKTTAESMPIEKMVDTLCAVEDLMGDVNNVMVAIHDDIKELVATAKKGTEKSSEAMTESGWVRLHMKEIVESLQGTAEERQLLLTAIRELVEELREGRGVSDNQ